MHRAAPTPRNPASAAVSDASFRGVRAIVALALAAACAPDRVAPRPLDDDTEASVQQLPDPPRSLEELRARIATVLARERVPGVAIALVDREGPIWVGGIGVADV